VLVAPLEDLVGVDSVLTRYTRDRCARHKCRLYDPPLLLRRAMNSLRPVATHTNFYRIAHKETVGHADAYVYTARPGRTFIVIYFRSLHFFGCPRTPHYFPMQKVDSTRIVNIHAASRN